MSNSRVEDTLTAIANEQVTWIYRGRGLTYRQWTDESTYTVITPKMKSVPDHLFRRQMTPGYRFTNRGYVELTREGWAALKGEGRG